MRLKKDQINQCFLTIISVTITIIIPMVNYFSFKNLINNIDCSTCSSSNVGQLGLGSLEATYDILIYFFVCIGIIISISTYSAFKFQKYSVKRELMLVFISGTYVFYVAGLSQMSVILIEISKIQIIMNFSSVYILFIIITSLYTVKNLYDLIDYKINQSHYSSILTDKKINKFKQKKFYQSLIKCPNCKYMCRIGWKKCPICKTKL